MNETLFPSEYQYINDTLSIAVLIKPTSTSTFNQFLGRWNMNTGEMIPMKYTHPDIQKKRITFAASEKAGIYVECYTRHDLMTICSLDGELLYNIYGPDWDGGNGNKLQSFGTVMIGNDKIFVSYCGEDYARDSFPTKILVFDLEGNYLNNQIHTLGNYRNFRHSPMLQYSKKKHQMSVDYFPRYIYYNQ